MTRTSGVPNLDFFGETFSGIEFRAIDDQNNIAILSRNTGRGTILNSKPLQITPGATYRFDITDDGNNTYLGETQINAGTIRVKHINALGSLVGVSSKGTVVADGATLEFAVANQTLTEKLTLNGQGLGGVGALRMSDDSGSSTIWSGAISLAGTAAIGVDSGNTLTISSVISPSTVAPTAKGLTKVGLGRLVLNAANTYTGTTTINAGELTINGNQPKSAIVLNGGTLSGKGTILGVTSGTVAGSHINPVANGLGKLLLKGKLALNSTTTYDVQIGGVNFGIQFDNIDVTGTVTLNGATLSPTIVNNFASTVGNKYQILTNDKTDAIVGTFVGLVEGASRTVNGAKFQITYKGGTGNDVVLTHVNTNSAFSHRSVTPVIDEGGIATLQGTIVEADPHDRFTLTINWGDGHREIKQFPAGSGGQLVTLTHRYLEGSAQPYDIALDWRDQHGGGKSDHLSVQVNSVAPSADISGPDTVVPGTQNRFQFQATDSTPIDQFGAMQWTIDWGDGSSISTSRRGNFSLSHVFKEPGDYIIRATARDNDGATSPIVIHRVHAEPIGGMASLLPQTLGELLMLV